MTLGISLGSTGLLLTLGLLALIDSTSIGTLIIPIWLVLRARNGSVLRSAVFYLVVLAGFYLAVGLLVLSGVDWVAALFNTTLTESVLARWVLLVIGAAMFIASFFVNRKPHEESQQRTTVALAAKQNSNLESVPSSASGSSYGKWGKRLDKALESKGGITILGLTAGLLELPTMLPYLGAIGLLTASDRPLSLQVGLLVLYCVVMIIPALLLIGVRAIAGQRLAGHFSKLAHWLAKTSGETLAWVVGIIGFLLLRSSIIFLFPEAVWNPFK